MRDNQTIPEMNHSRDREDAMPYVRVSDGQFVAAAFAGSVASEPFPGHTDECLVPAVEDLSTELHERSKQNHLRAGRIAAEPVPVQPVELSGLSDRERLEALMREILSVVRDVAELRREVSAVRQDVRNVRAKVGA